MKKLSIKFKITLWYTIFMALLVLFTLFLMFRISNARILSNLENRLKNAVIGSFDEVSYRENALYFDDDFVTLGFEKGIYISVYDSVGNLLYGRLPTYYNGPANLTSDKLQQEYDFHTQWYAYDYLMEIDGYGPLWIRGITSQTAEDRMLTSILRVSMYIFPSFVLCILVGGYFIIRRTLAPLDKVTETAAAIEHGNDLSRRINLPVGEDEVHRLASAFDHMTEQLQASFEREKQFTSDASHELRTPIAVILSQCEYALAEDVTISEKNESLRTIQQQSKKMSQLISQLLTLSRADKGTITIQRSEIDLSELAEIICEQQQEFASEKNITIFSEIWPGLRMQGDETMLMQFFINLINNAITYGRENGHVTLSLCLEQNSIRGYLQDDGIGIAPEHLPHIWERFYQAEPSRSSSLTGGAGLGLPMVKWIAEAHGGSIWAESTPGNGTVFSFEFPSFEKK